LGELEELQETSVWVEVRDSVNKFPNKGPVNGFKRVATLHPESEKQDDTKGIQMNQQTDQLNQRNNQQNSTFQQPKSTKTSTKLTRNAKCFSGNCQPDYHRPEFTGVIIYPARYYTQPPKGSKDN